MSNVALSVVHLKNGQKTVIEGASWYSILELRNNTPNIRRILNQFGEEVQEANFQLAKEIFIESAHDFEVPPLNISTQEGRNEAKRKLREIFDTLSRLSTIFSVNIPLHLEDVLPQLLIEYNVAPTILSNVAEYLNNLDLEISTADGIKRIGEFITNILPDQPEASSEHANEPQEDIMNIINDNSENHIDNDNNSNRNNNIIDNTDDNIINDNNDNNDDNIEVNVDVNRIFRMKDKIVTEITNLTTQLTPLQLQLIDITKEVNAIGVSISNQIQSGLKNYFFMLIQTLDHASVPERERNIMLTQTINAFRSIFNQFRHHFESYYQLNQRFSNTITQMKQSIVTSRAFTYIQILSNLPSIVQAYNIHFESRPQLISLLRKLPTHINNHIMQWDDMNQREFATQLHDIPISLSLPALPSLPTIHCELPVDDHDHLSIHDNDDNDVPRSSLQTSFQMMLTLLYPSSDSLLTNERGERVEASPRIPPSMLQMRIGKQDELRELLQTIELKRRELNSLQMQIGILTPPSHIKLTTPTPSNNTLSSNNNHNNNSDDFIIYNEIRNDGNGTNNSLQNNQLRTNNNINNRSDFHTTYTSSSQSTHNPHTTHITQNVNYDNINNNNNVRQTQNSHLSTHQNQQFHSSNSSNNYHHQHQHQHGRMEDEDGIIIIDNFNNPIRNSLPPSSLDSHPVMQVVSKFDFPPSEIHIFFDFDGTLFDRDGQEFQMLMLQDRFEEANQLQKRPLKMIPELLQRLNHANYNLYILTKQDNPNIIRDLLLKEGLMFFEAILCQRNELVGSKTITISKGKILCEYLLNLEINQGHLNNVRGIIFVDDIEENCLSVSQELRGDYPSIRSSTIHLTYDDYGNSRSRSVR